MTRNRETPDETAKLLYGMSSVRDWLEKAKREKDRFLESNDSIDQTDHVINFCITASHIEDWVFNLHIQGNTKEWPNHQTSRKFDQWVRNESLAMLLLADVNNAAKHRVLDSRGSNTESAEIGGVNYYIDHLPAAHDFIDKISKFSDMINIRTVVDDDEIQGYEIITNAHKLSGEDGFKLFIDIANESIRFWEKFLEVRGL
jgi:hypothetical protein